MSKSELHRIAIQKGEDPHAARESFKNEMSERERRDRHEIIADLVAANKKIYDMQAEIDALRKELEQVKIREAEIIAKAKDEQRESDALVGKEWANDTCEESWKPASIFNTIRNNNE